MVFLFKDFFMLEICCAIILSQKCGNGTHFSLIQYKCVNTKFIKMGDCSKIEKMSSLIEAIRCTANSLWKVQKHRKN